jgi:hypothetical protein
MTPLTTSKELTAELSAHMPGSRQHSAPSVPRHTGPAMARMMHVGRSFTEMIRLPVQIMVGVLAAAPRCVPMVRDELECDLGASRW